MGFAMLQRHRKPVPVPEAVEAPVPEPKREPESEPEQAPPPKPVGRRRKKTE
jgi:hypothetical protein